MSVELTDELAADWAADLRSGLYVQGRRVLRSEIGDRTHHCCLGVLCDRLVRTDTEWEWHKDIRWGWSIHFTPAGTPAAGKLRGELSSFSHLPEWLLGDAQRRLSHLNDSEKRDFGYIADWIEGWFGIADGIGQADA